MKNILNLTFLFLLTLGLPALANEYISAYDLAVVDNKAYLLEVSNGQTFLNQYSFPDLVAGNHILLEDDFSYAYASSNGVVVNSYTYDIPTETLVAEGDGSQTKGYKDIHTMKTYDLSLQLVATKTVENEYYYTFIDSSSADGSPLTASGKATSVADNKCVDNNGKKHKGKNKACNKVLL